MGKIHLRINDEIDEQFRYAVGARLGARKGNLALALEEAIKLWIEKYQ